MPLPDHEIRRIVKEEFTPLTERVLTLEKSVTATSRAIGKLRVFTRLNTWLLAGTLGAMVFLAYFAITQKP